MMRASQRFRLIGVIVAALALVAGIPTILVAAQLGSPWILAPATAVAAAMAGLGAGWQDRYVRASRERDEREVSVREGCLMLNGRLPKVNEVRNPLYLGVHRASGPGAAGRAGHDSADSRVPVYVPRDLDAQLRERLASGGFILIVGDSTAGKTRSAFEAAVATLPEHFLVAPRDRAALPSALAKATEMTKCILWLNDLEQYVGALSRYKIAELIEQDGSHRVILATLRAAEEARFTSDSIADQSGRQAYRGALEVLEVAERVHMPRLFSLAERERARARTWDPRIADALLHADSYGIAEYVAAGPELVRDWDDAWSPNTDPEAPANPRGAALVMAAVDIRRAGYTSAIPNRLIDDVHDHYLASHGGIRLHPESLADAWAWACRPRRATTALLQPADDHHVDVFDYLVDVVQRSRPPGDHVPGHVVCAAAGSADPADLDSIAATAYTQGRYELAEYAYKRAIRIKAADADLGQEHPRTLISRDRLALTLIALGRPEEAEAEQRAVLSIAARTLGPEHQTTRQPRQSRQNPARTRTAGGGGDRAPRGPRPVHQSARRRAPGHDRQPQQPRTSSARSRPA